MNVIATKKRFKTPTEVLREFVLSSFENFVRYFQVEFYSFNPNLYDYQLKITDKLEEVIQGKITKLNINIPPRYRKTYLAVKLFMAYSLAVSKGKAKFIHVSYSKKLALDNSEEVKDIVQSDAFQRLFPEVQIKKDSKAKEKWYTTAGGGVYATSAGGQVTGFGAGSSPEEYEEEEENVNDTELKEMVVEFIDGWNPNEKFGGAIIIDDANKPEDASFPNILSKVNQRYDTTIKNRVNSRYTPIINIQQRVAPKDLSGHLQNLKKQNGEPLFDNLILPALDEDGNALCEAIHTKEELLQLKSENEPVFNCQYGQKPKPSEGLMYENGVNRTILDRETVVNGAELLFSSTDANQTDGNDYFVTWFWAIYQGGIFIYDCIFEQIATKNLKPAFIERHKFNQSQIAVIEQNNQQTFIGEIQYDMSCSVMPITSKGNKLAKIIAKAHLISKVNFLKNDENPRYEKAINHLETFNKNGTHEDGHDDPEDAWTLGMDYLWVNYRHLFIS